MLVWGVNETELARLEPLVISFPWHTQPPNVFFAKQPETGIFSAVSNLWHRYAAPSKREPGAVSFPSSQPDVVHNFFLKKRPEMATSSVISMQSVPGYEYLYLITLIE